MKQIIITLAFASTAFAIEMDFNHDGWDREALLFRPSCIPDDPNIDFEPVPLVIMFHGLGGVGADYYGWGAGGLAEDSCFFVVFPSGLYNTWNAGPDTPYGHDIDDNSYLEALIDTIYNIYPIDTNRIYATGHSQGGGMANHLACSSRKYTATGSSGGYINGNYEYNGDNYDDCHPSDGYVIPTIHTHGLPDFSAPTEWAQMAAIKLAHLNQCKDILDVFNGYDWTDFPIYEEPYPAPHEYQDYIDDFWITADTLQYTNTLSNAIHRYQWSKGCHTEPSTEVILLPGAGHSWHQPWNSSISTPLEHWNFFRQFSKDKMAPALDSLKLPDNVTLDETYYDSSETALIKIIAVDNYSVASMTISFSGFVNVEGFDINLIFDTDERLLDSEVGVALDPNISTDSYETVQVIITDHDGNEKLYDLEALQELGLYQQMAVVNNLTVSTDNETLGPKVFAIHQNYPNPFNPVTTLRYDLPEDGLVDITIYDMLGNVVSNLINTNQSSGYKSIQWDATNNQGEPVSAGVYLYKIQAGDFVDTKKMILLK